MKLIGFSGMVGHPQGSGKDSAASIVQDLAMHSGLVTHRCSFADPIKAMLSMLYPEWHFHVDKEAPIPGIAKSGRELMELLAHDWGRVQVHPDIWIKHLAKSVSMLPGVVDLVLVTDVRYENEASWIRSHGGMVIRVVRPDIPRPQLDRLHPSRTEVFDVDHTISTSDLDGLRHKLSAIYMNWTGGSGIPLGELRNFRFKGVA